MSILVTGGAGFIGSHLIRRLLSSDFQKGDFQKDGGRQIVCLDNFNDYYDPQQKRKNVAAFVEEPRFTLVEADFCDQALVAELFAREQVEQVIHLGAYAGVHYSVDHPEIYQRANVLGTLSLLEAARRHPVQRFLSASSSTVYGVGAAAPFVEDAPLGTPASPYGVSKRAAELLCGMYHHLHGVPTVSLRLFSVYGPGLRPDLAMTIFTKKIAAGEPLPLYGDGTIRRDFTHVDDICSGFIAALTAEDVVGEEINLGHNEPVEIRRLIELLETALGKKANIEHHTERAGDLPLTHADLSKAKRLLDYRPTVDMEAGVRQYVEWFLR